MNLIRKRLQQTQPELYNAYERSWDIAWEEWFSAIPVNNDSFNSYPHIRNHELYLEKLVTAYENLGGNRNDSKYELFSPQELYVLLTSILLHDIGRTVVSKGHGKESRKIIEEHWSNLGIPNQEIAFSIAKICEFHDFDPQDAPQEIQKLSTVVIDPWGRIREREIAAVIYLIDHIDCSYTRTVCEYLRESGKEALGAFRSKIQGIDIDLEGGLIKVALAGDWKERDEEKEEEAIPLEYKIDIEGLIEMYAEKVMKEKKKNIKEILNTKNRIKYIYKIGKGKIPQDINNKIYAAIIKEEKEILLDDKEINGMKNDGLLVIANGNNGDYPVFNLLSKNKLKFTMVEHLIINKIIRAKRREQEPSDLLQITSVDFKPFCGVNRISSITKWDNLPINPMLSKIVKLFLKKYPTKKRKKEKIFPPSILLAMILSDTQENKESLIAIEKTLSAMGLPIRVWCIEHDERLFNWKGQETFEPIYSQEFLNRTVEAMWKLSTGIFGVNTLGYETLASQMREPDIKKVKRAVRRIGIVSRNLVTPKTIESAFWIGQDSWRWNVKCEKEKKCEFIHKVAVLNRINELENPKGDENES